MNAESTLTRELTELLGVATGGFAIGLHVRFATPSYMLQTYPKAWLDIYSREGLLMRDPAIAWAFAHQGVVRWSDLEGEDEAEIFSRAKAFGLVHGLTVSLLRGDSRSIGGFARPDRYFAPEEVEQIEAAMLRLHDSTDSGQPLSEEEREALRRLSVAFTHP